jgi:hypothetical protein
MIHFSAVRPSLLLPVVALALISAAFIACDYLQLTVFPPSSALKCGLAARTGLPADTQAALADLDEHPTSLRTCVFDFTRAPDGAEGVASLSLGTLVSEQLPPGTAWIQAFDTCRRIPRLMAETKQTLSRPYTVYTTGESVPCQDSDVSIRALVVGINSYFIQPDPTGAVSRAIH